MDSSTYSSFNVDTLTNEIFSILENKFLFESLNFPLEDDHLKNNTTSSILNSSSPAKVRILSIDGQGSTGGILAAKSLSHLETSLQKKSGRPDACIADFFDVVTGSGVGGIIAALLFTKGSSKDGRPMFTADEAMNFLIQNRRKLISSSSSKGLFRFNKAKASEKLLRQTFGECTLKDTLKPLLVPCFDLSTHATFMFSRADALETDGFDFMMSEVCLATSAGVKAFEMKSVDRQTKILAVNGGVAVNNPTAAAITHVLNNKQEFPFCDSVEDLLVVSLGNGELSGGSQDQKLSSTGFVSIAGEASSDAVDQAVSMAFGEFRATNYARIQANELLSRNPTSSSKSDGKNQLRMAEEMLKQRNVESVLFKGKQLTERTNLEKLELLAGELIKENEKRKLSVLPTIFLKQVSPRLSSATVSSTISFSSY